MDHRVHVKAVAKKQRCAFDWRHIQVQALRAKQASVMHTLRRKYQILLNQVVERSLFIGIEVVFGNAHIGLAHVAAAPIGQSHAGLIFFCSSMAWRSHAPETQETQETAT